MPVGVYAKVKRERVWRRERGDTRPLRRESEGGRRVALREADIAVLCVLTLKGTKVSRRTKRDEATPKGIFRRKRKSKNCETFFLNTALL